MTKVIPISTLKAQLSMMLRQLQLDPDLELLIGDHQNTFILTSASRYRALTSRTDTEEPPQPPTAFD